MKRKLIIYIIALVVLIAGYFAVTRIPEKADEEKVSGIRLLEGFEIKSIEVENGYGKYVLTYDDTDCTMDGVRVKGECIARLSDISSDLKIDSDDLKAFGLENPASRVTLTSKDGGVKTLLVGDLIPDKTARYVMSDGVYVVSNEYIDWLTQKKDILKNKNLYSESSPKKIEFNGICFEIIDGVWQMTKPYRHGVRGEEFNKEVLENLNFTAVDFSDYSPEECGLKPPKHYISVWDSKGANTTVYLGNTENGLVYAMREGGGDICRIAVPGFLDKTPIFFLNKLCYVKNIDEIDSIQVNEFLFELSDGYKKNGKPIAKEAFIEFYKQLMGMTLIDEAKDPVRDKMILSMTVSFKNGTKDVVEVFSYKERYGAVFINGICEFYTLLESAKEIVSEAETL